MVTLFAVGREGVERWWCLDLGVGNGDGDKWVDSGSTLEAGPAGLGVSHTDLPHSCEFWKASCI